MTTLSYVFFRFRWLHFPAMVLMFLLQKTPVLRALITTEFTVHVAAGTVLKGVLASAAAMGTVQALAGATALNAGTGGNPVSGTVGQSFAGGFAVTGAPAVAGSYQITGTLPPGLSIPGIVGNTLNGSLVTITGTPTQSGSFALSVTAWKGPNRTQEGGSPDFTYTIQIAAAAGVAPAITTQPQALSVTAGNNAIFTVAATGDPAPTYQWRKSGVNISGATSATFTVSNATSGDAGNYSVVVTNASGNQTSSTATLTVTAAEVAPTITAQPQSKAAGTGQGVTFSVTATGNPTPTFQWRKNGSAISGATSASFSIGSVTSGDNGAYSVVVTNAIGSATSAAANLTVSASQSGPSFVSHPVSQTVAPGGSVTFSVSTVTTGSASLQWTKNGTAIAGATSNSLVLNSVSATNSGRYTLQVTDSVGSIESRDAYLLVAIPQTGAIVNESVNTSVGPGASLTVGFVIDGGSRQMLIRGVGPSLGLAPFGLQGVLPNPVLQLNFTGSGGGVLETNSGWNNDSAIAATAQTVGAFALSSLDDAAVLRTLNSGPHTAVISSGNTASGTAIVEAYAAGSGGGQLVNLSARKRLDDSNPTLTAGFSVNGNVPQRMLIRAVGPSLNQFLNGAELDDPKLTLNRLVGPAGEVLGVVLTNDDWLTEGNVTEIMTAAASVGAFPLVQGGKDAAVLVTLPTGNYTVQVERKGSAAGDALIEVYAAP
jgi:hypothetical protein